MATDVAVVVVAAEVITPLEQDSAQRLDRRIRRMVDAINEHLGKLEELVEEAKRGEIHKALGFRSWTEYVVDVFAVKVRLDREQRQELVGYLSGEGMSQRAIADVVGTSQDTVRRDLATGERFRSPEFEAEPSIKSCLDCGGTLGWKEGVRRCWPCAETEVAAAGADRSNELTAVEQELPPLSENYIHGGVSSGPPQDATELAEPNPITGVDGKTYHPKTPRPQPDPVAPKPRSRTPLPESFGQAVSELTRITKRLEAASADDRFKKNADQMTHRVSDLIRARDALQRVIDKFSN